MAAVANTAGHDHRALCGAKKKQGEGTCTQVAGWGVPGTTTGRCKLHGGSTRNHVKAANEAKAQAAIARFGIGRADTMDPAEVLMREVARAAHSVQWYEREISSLCAAEEPDEAKIVDYRDQWRIERKIAATVSAAAIGAGVARRQVELLEGLARQAVQWFALFAINLGLDPSSPEVREAGRAALELAQGGGDAIPGSAVEVG